MAFRIRLRSLLNFMKRWHQVSRRRIGCRNSPGAQTPLRCRSRMFVSSMRSRPMDFTKSFEETNGSPREVSDRLNSINSQPPLLYPATTIKAKSCGPDSGREEVRSQRVPLWNLTGVWNWAVRKIEPDAKDRIYYGAKDLQNLLANHGEKMEITDRKSTRLNSSHTVISYAVFCLKKKKK